MVALTSYTDSTGTPRPIHGVTLLNPDGTQATAGGGSGGDASAANQTAVQANAGADATKVTAVQGVTGGKAITVSFSAAQAVTQSGTWNVGLTGTLPAFAATPTFNLGTTDTANLAAVNTVQGAVADAAYAGSGSATVVSILKGIYAAPTFGNVASGTTDSGAPVKIGGVYVTTPAAVTTGQRVDLALSARGRVVNELTQFGLIDAQSNANIGSMPAGGLTAVPLWTVSSVFNGSTWDRQKKPSSTSRIVSAAATTNATSAKASAGDLFGFDAYNATAAVKFLKFYNKASAPTVGTDTPVMTVALAPNARTSMAYPSPLYFSTGIAYAMTGAAADADTTALAAADVVGVNLNFQ